QMNCHPLDYLKSYHYARARFTAAARLSNAYSNKCALYKEDLEILQANPLNDGQLTESISKLDRLFKSNCRIRRSKPSDGSFLVLTVCPLKGTFSVTNNG